MLLRLLSVVAALFTTTPHLPAPTLDPAPAAPVRHVLVVRPHPARVVDGADVSWPNCPPSMGIPGAHGYDLPMPTRSARFVVVGTTNGPGFTRNPCLRSQVVWAERHHLWLSAYAVISFPTRAELLRYGGRGHPSTRIARVGAAEVRFALAGLRQVSLRAPMVWLDVEPVGGHAWSAHASLNRALVAGAIRQLQRSHVRVGIYSYRYAWLRIAGDWRLPQPTWVPTGSPHRADAVARCRVRSFSGGRVLLTQWTGGSRDFDVTCPGAALNVRQAFRLP